MSAPDILVQIAEARAARVARGGANQGLELPAQREAPVVPFAGAIATGDPILIAEVKRASPSRGAIAEIPDPVDLARQYRRAGFRRVSVLTEEEHFSGSLADLVAVKSAVPDVAVLRKDFLLSVEDVEVSWRAGADAVLLIAALLDAETFLSMYRRAADLGVAVLVEVHGAEDVAMVRPLRPPLVGINSRDLRRFTIEPLVPLQTRTLIDWPCAVIYESGVRTADDARFVRGARFQGLLVGEAAARSPAVADEIAAVWREAPEIAERRYAAWERLYRRYRPGQPFVKICGITNRDDAEAAVAAGADLIGFVLASSPRQTTPDFVRSCSDIEVLKCAVVVLGADDEVPAELAQLVTEGAIDFIQFHGDERVELVARWPAYKALQVAGPEDADRIDSAGSPAVLVDAFSRDARGGTGKRLNAETIAAVAARRTPWIAGGLTPESVREIVQTWRPGLVDVSSGVEREKGIKDHGKVRAFVQNAKGVQQ